jgi:hypothetical protein
VVDDLDLVAVIVTDKNGRTSRRWKKPENVKPGDVVITDESQLPKRPAVRTATKPAASTKKPSASKKTAARKPAAKPLPKQDVPKWDVEDVIRDSDIAFDLGDAAASLLPQGVLVSYEVFPSRVEFLVADVFGYESVLVADFENCLSIVERNGSPVVEFILGSEPRIFRLEGQAFVVTLGYGERRLVSLIRLAWDVVLESRGALVATAVAS